MYHTAQPCVFKRYPIRTNISPPSKHSCLICVHAECRGHAEERQHSLNVVFNQSSLMPGCWENKQPICTLHSSTCLWASSARLLNFYQRSAVMSCMHSCRECVLPFLLSHLATIAAAKESSSFCRCKQIIHRPKPLWSFHALPVGRNRNWARSPSCLWNLMDICCCLLIPQTHTL